VDVEADCVSAFSERFVRALLLCCCGAEAERDEPTEGRNGEGLEERVGGFMGCGGGRGIAMRKT
jgi:hypothetical protein